MKGVAADWVWTTDAELLSGLDYDASRNEIICTAAKSKQGSGLVALFDAEALLLIEAYERAIGKLYRRLEYGMGAEADRILPLCKRLERALLLICWGR